MDHQLCVICLLQYTKIAPAILLSKCKHQFHEKCLQDWCEQYYNACPICKWKFNSTDLSPLIEKDQVDVKINLTSNEVLKLERFEMQVTQNTHQTKNELQICFTAVDKKILVFLVDYFGQSWILNVNLSMSIFEFCNLVQQQTGISKENVRFYVNGKPFDYRTLGILENLPIQEKSTIHLLQRR